MQEQTSTPRPDGENPPSGGQIPGEEVEAELRQVLASRTFRNAPRHCRFLSFVVGKALASEGESIKEYLIGLEVFDRSTDYDPGSDPVVRVEAGRLRTRLRSHYRGAGKHDPVYIELPKGTYVPVFQRNNPNIAIPGNGQDLQAETTLPGRRHWVLWGLAAALLCSAAGYGIHVVRSRKSRAASSSVPKPANVVVLAEFTNTTGDAVFDDTLRQGLASQLEQSPFLNLLSDDRIAQALSLMSQPPDARLTQELALEVCHRTGSIAAIDGSIARMGAQYTVGLTAVGCADGKHLAEEQGIADGKDQVLSVLGKTATKLRRKLGESLASVQSYDVAPEKVTTPSLEALQAYSRGFSAMDFRNDYAAAQRLFEQAIRLDPNFAMAYGRLGTIYMNQAQTDRAAEMLFKAYDLRDRVSERERFYIDSHYHQLVTGNLEAASKTYELWTQTYPWDDTPPANLGVTYAELGAYEKSLAAYQDAFRVDPEAGLAYGNLIFSYVSLNRLDEARALARQAQNRHIDSPLIHAYLYYLAFLERDDAGMEREAGRLLGKAGWEDSMLYFQADTAAYHGKFAKARELMQRATDSAQHADEKETAAVYQAIAAVHEALVGNVKLARQQAQAAMAASGGKDVEAVSAIALALAGDSEQASRLASKLNKRFPEDTVVQFSYLPTIHAALALQNGDASKAVVALVPSAPYEMGRGPQVWLYPVYLRGGALLAQHQGATAVAEFQAILNHPGVVLNEPVGALARLGLGRAHALTGDTAKARTAYQDFLALWKDADRDIPIYQQAKAEYAKLQ